MCFNDDFQKLKSQKQEKANSVTAHKTAKVSTVCNGIQEIDDMENITVLCKQRGKSVELEANPDSGCSKSILPMSAMDSNGLIYNAEHNSYLTCANGTDMTVNGTAKIEIYFQGNKINTEVLVSEDTEIMLMSRKDMKRLRILPPNFPNVIDKSENVAAVDFEIVDEKSEASEASEASKADSVKVNKQPLFTEAELQENMEKLQKGVNRLLTDYAPVFDKTNLKPMRGPPMTIKFKEGIKIKPIKVTTCSEPPIHLRPSAEALIEKRLREGTIEDVPEGDTSPWCFRMHFVMKQDGSARDVLDCSPLNPMVERPVHTFPSVKDVKRRIPPSARFFLTLDMASSYHLIPLDEPSKRIMTFLCPVGRKRYRYTRAVMGLSCSSDEFCRRSDESLEGLEDMFIKIVDDALLFSDTVEGLLRNAEAFIERCSQRRITLNADKIQFGDSVRFAGFLVTAEGIRMHPDRAAAIRDFAIPSTQTEVRSFLGLANQMAQWHPDLAHATADLRELVKAGVHFHWLPEHQKSFEQTKKLLLTDNVLKPFDTNRKTFLMTDASRLFGLGWALLQEYPEYQVPKSKNSKETKNALLLVEAGSRSLIPAETRYSTTILELTAVITGILKLKYYLLACPFFTVIVDHSPLKQIFEKDIGDLENIKMIVLREKVTDFNFVIEWWKGKDLALADILSRLTHHAPPEKMDKEIAVCSAVKLQHQTLTLDQLREDAKEDNEYKKIKQLRLKDLAPENIPANHPARPYKQFWDDISIEDELLVRWDDDKKVHLIIPPTASRKEIIRLMHITHSGLAKAKTKARSMYYWHKMSAQLEQAIAECRQCIRFSPSQQAEPINQRFANEPMEAIGTDFFHEKGRNYLILVDRFSGYIWVRKTQSQTTDTVIKLMTPIFREFGFPQSVESDGGPCYRDAFTEWCRSNGIHHIKSSAEWHRSNGLSEAAVSNAKTLLKKHESNWEIFEVALAEFNRDPRRDGYSPAQMFFKRETRGLLPSLRETRHLDVSKGAEKRRETKAQEKKHHDARAKPLEPLNVGDRVVVQDKKSNQWIHYGRITGLHKSKHSFWVKFDRGNTLRKNRAFIKRVPEDSHSG